MRLILDKNSLNAVNGGNLVGLSSLLSDLVSGSRVKVFRNGKLPAISNAFSKFQEQARNEPSFSSNLNLQFAT